jgi:hypothetical protein
MEKTVQVVKNHEDGTRPAFWQGQAETPNLNRETGQEQAWEWTSQVHVDGGAIFGNPKRGAWWRPGRESQKASSSARQKSERSLRIREEEKWKPLRGEQPGFSTNPSCPGRSQHPATAGTNDEGIPAKAGTKSSTLPLLLKVWKAWAP